MGKPRSSTQACRFSAREADFDLLSDGDPVLFRFGRDPGAFPGLEGAWAFVARQQPVEMGTGEPVAATEFRHGPRRPRFSLWHRYLVSNRDLSRSKKVAGGRPETVSDV